MSDDWGPAYLSASKEIGELVLTQRWDGPPNTGPGYLTIEHADPHILIAREIAWRIARGESHPCVKIYTSCTCRTCGDLCLPHLASTKLEIHARDRKLIYRFAEYRFDMGGYLVEWPD